MTRSTRFIVTILIGMMTGQSVFSQYYVKFKSDSLGFVKDSVILSIQAEAADIEWQVSNDSVTWHSLDETNDSLLIRIDSCAYYRAVLTDGTCYPLKSDVARVAFQSSEVSGNTFTVDPSGGVYILPSGIKIIVPPGAVSEPASISMDLLDKNQADIKIPFGIFAGREFCAGMYCNPAGIHFQKPVRLVMPAANYKYTDLQCIYIYNPDSELWDQHFGTLLCSEERRTIEFSTEDLYPARVELIHDAFGKAGSFEGKEDPGGRICQRGLVEIMSSSHDYMGKLANGTCQATTNSAQATFLSCKDQPVSKDFVQEIGEQCKPTVTASWDEGDCLYGKGAKAHITFHMQIAGLPLAKNEIILDLPSGLEKKSPAGDIITEDNGSISVEVECTVDNLKGTVKYTAIADYYLRIQKVSGAAGSEENYQEERIVALTDSLQIKTCPEVTRLRLNWSAWDDQRRIKQNETYYLLTGCYYSDNTGEHEVDPCLCEYYIDHTVPEGKNVIELDPENETVTTRGGGIAYVKARLKGTDIESNMLEIRVPFEGSFKFSMENANVRRCYCDENPDLTVREWFLMSYWAEGLIRLHLYEHYTNLGENNFGSIEGEHSFAYTSTSEYCRNYTSPVEPFFGGYLGFTYTYDPWKIRAVLADYYAPCSTQDVLDGKRFELSFHDCVLYDTGYGSYYPTLSCKMNSAGDIEYTTATPGDWLGEECVGRVTITGVLH